MRVESERVAQAFTLIDTARKIGDDSLMFVHENSCSMVRETSIKNQATSKLRAVLQSCQVTSLYGMVRFPINQKHPHATQIYQL